MGPSEMVDSGRFSGGRSNFSQTCSLLSRYLKEKGSFGDIRLSFANNVESKGAPTQTMNLLPMIEKSGQNPCPRNTNSPPAGETQKKSDLSGAKPEAETAPMTIFYAGKVIVFNDFPANKAKELMMLAHKSCASAPASPSPGESASSLPNIAAPALESDLPIARKNSLARFLGKRKDRITANAPYPANKPAEAAPPPKSVKTEEAWLGLSPNLPRQIQRH